MCFQPLLLNSTTVQCTALASPVGAYLVTGTLRALLFVGWLGNVLLSTVREVCCCVGPRAVSLNGQNGTSSTILHRLCGAGKFGLPGTTCGNCPPVRVAAIHHIAAAQSRNVSLVTLVVALSFAYLQSAECVALFPLPLPKPGFYAESMTKFVSCVPTAACPGVNASAVAAAFSIPAASGVLRCDHLSTRQW